MAATVPASCRRQQVVADVPHGFERVLTIGRRQFAMMPHARAIVLMNTRAGPRAGD